MGIMAPNCFPEEVDVFTIPHSRMKELVNKYLEMLTETNFDDAFRMTSLLENLSVTFKEFKAHEQIENRCIMRKLKQKLRALSITNTAVCNCHKDNKLTEMMNLFRDGYRCTRKTAADRINYGLKLRQALETFTDQFIPHMKEEEEVFQPLLMQHFTYDELRDLKALVLEEHLRTVAEDHEQKLVEDSVSSESYSDEEEEKSRSPFDSVPDEVLLKILSHLDPFQLGQCAQVNQRFTQLVFDPDLWANFYPVLWAKGDWTFTPDHDLGLEQLTEKEYVHTMLDEDADIDESGDSDESDSQDASIKQLKKEVKLLSQLTRYVLPKMGRGVRTLNLSDSIGLTSGILYKMLLHCPNLERLELCHTRISDSAFKCLGRDGRGSKLKHVDLGGCDKVTDVAIDQLAHALHFKGGTDGKNDTTEKSLSIKLVSESTNSLTDNVSSAGCAKSQKTMRNENFCSRPLKNSLLTFCADGSACQRNTDSIRTKRSTLLECAGESSPSVQKCDFSTRADCLHASCSKLLTELRQMELDYDKMTFCMCPLSRRKMRSSTVRSVNIEDCSLYGYHGQTKSVDCDTRAAIPAVRDSPPCSTKTVTPDLTMARSMLEHLNLSGCYLVTDEGLSALAAWGGLPSLRFLDLSGCLNITSPGLQELVEACPSLDHAHLYYCDNLRNDPYPLTASGCQNLGCGRKVCCRTGT